MNKPSSGERAILVHIHFYRCDQEDLIEFKQLAMSAGAEVASVVTATRNLPDPKYLMGSGKANEIRGLVLLLEADLVLVNHNLTPAQERNLETIFQCRVLDRTGLILDIFAQRARSFEGKLQVELAQLNHLATRLVRGWTHLERQKGGIGLRGPGETQLETDRRMIRQRIQAITKRLQKVRRQRQHGRLRRRKMEIPTVSLVGYTNAGKSTLFNALTQSQAFVADQLFATLDPTLRRIKLLELGNVVLADTVGFVRHLPHDLVEAFRATLEETRGANLLLHVVDVANPDHLEIIEQVNHVLADIEADSVPQLIVYNKLDLIDGMSPKIDRDQQGRPWRVWLSATTGEGMDCLQQAIVERLTQDWVTCELVLGPDQASLRARLYATNSVTEERVDADGNWLLTCRLTRRDYNQLNVT